MAARGGGGVSVMPSRGFIRPLGKVRQRVQDLRSRSHSRFQNLVTPGSPRMDLSHNECARLAADSLLTGDLEGYHRVLQAEGEVDFLSRPEKSYILDNATDGSKAGSDACEDGVEDKGLECACSQSATQCPGQSTSDNPSCIKDANTNGHRIAIYFQNESKPAGIQDVVREFINKAKVALAIVMDSFTDVELLCDLLEATKKRNVAVHLLLDHLNLHLFINMWQGLGLNGKTFPKLSVRSVSGLPYSAQTGRTMSGQIAENFIVVDGTEVLTGSYSFSWLSWQVHRSLAVLFKGSMVPHFQQEFLRLYSSSKPVPGFVTHRVRGAQPASPPTGQSASSQVKTTGPGASDRDAQTKAKMPVSSNPQKAEPKCGRDNAQSLNGSGAGTPPLSQLPPMQSVPEEKPKHTETLDENQNQIQSPSNPLGQTISSCVGTSATTAEKNVSAQESRPLNDASPADTKQLTSPLSISPGLNGQPNYSLSTTLTSQQKLVNPGLWFLSAQDRGLTPRLQTNVSSFTGTRWQDQQRPGAMLQGRRSSLTATYGQKKDSQVGWGMFQSSEGLRRVKSMTERQMIGFHPIKTRI